MNQYFPLQTDEHAEEETADKEGEEEGEEGHCLFFLQTCMFSLFMPIMEYIYHCQPDQSVQ